MATIIGGNADETITGGFVSPSVTGGTPSAAADSIVAGDGADSVRGEGGNDTLIGGDGADTLLGGDNDDRIESQPLGFDLIDGGEGNDTIIGGGGTTADGGAGNDLVLPNSNFANETYFGGAGIDTIVADSDGFDYIFDLGTGTTNFVGEVFSGFEAVIGGNGNDFFSDANVTAANALDGGAGNDTLNGRFGDDTLQGGAGADSLDAGESDFLSRDFLSYATDTAGVSINVNASSASGGDAAGDSFNGLSFDGVIGGAGNDALTGRDAFTDTLLGGEGNDSLTAFGAAGDVMSGEGGNDTINGGTGNDTLEGGAGGDTLIAGGGVDWLSYAADTVGVTIDLQFNLATSGDARNDIFNGSTFSGVIGGAGADVLAGRSNFTDTLLGGGGADRLTFGAGADVMAGGEGNDTLEGGSGADSLRGDENNDSILGGAGNDTIDLRSTRADSDTVDAGADNDLIILGSGLGTVNGGAGIDTVDSSDFTGAYLVDLESGATNFNESILGIEAFIAGSGTDTILGSSVENRIIGGGGIDSLAGRGGSDTLEGGAGDDTLDGGNGFDVARYTDSPGALKITLSGGQILVRTATNTDVLTSIEAISTADGSVTLGTDLSGLFGIAVGLESFSGLGTAYVGPVAGLQRQYLGSGAGEVVIGTTGNDFINLLGGVDAADGGAGNDVIDGGLGSNFLTGGTGIDTFFSDGRGGGITWSTITDFQPGEQLSLFGWRPGVSRRIMVESDGAEGFKGATMHADLDGNGVFDTSVTWSGLTLAQVPVPLEFADPQLLWFIG